MERFALPVFFTTRSFADQDQSRIRVADAIHQVCSGRGKATALAIPQFGANRVEGFCQAGR